MTHRMNNAVTRELFEADRLGSRVFVEGGTKNGYVSNFTGSLGKYLGTGVLAAVMAAGCGGGDSTNPPPPPPPPPQTANYSINLKQFFDNSPITNENVRLNHGPTNTEKETTTNNNGLYSLNFDVSVVANPNADSTLKIGQPTSGGNTPNYKVTRTESNLGTTSKTLQDVKVIPRFVEQGTNTDLWDWYTFETGSGTEVNWTYPISVFLDESNPFAHAQGRDYPTALKESFGSWEGCSTALLGKLFNYVSTAKPPSAKGIEIVYISDQTKPCTRPVAQVVNNNEIINDRIEVNILCVINNTFINQGKHETGHALGYGQEDPVNTRIMNPFNAVNNPNATQSPVECKGTEIRYALPIGFRKSDISK